MHGRVKVRTTAEQEALKKIEREKKVAKYKAAITLVFEKRKNRIYDDDLFLATEHMVLKVPDINTLWNIRREAFEHNQWNEEEYVDRLKKELVLTENCLRENPKSYSVWHQRCWIIDHLPSPDWTTELALCAKCLNVDERNFHCWDYRQHLVKKAGISDEAEFEFSTTKILNNFSNYSSWHYRSKILSKLFPDEHGILPINATKHREELDLVMDATFTDPNDSSAWFYQRWLLDYNEAQPNPLWQIKVTNSKATVIFHECTCIGKDNLTLSITCTNNLLNNESNVSINDITTWSSYKDQLFSNIWFSNISGNSEDSKKINNENWTEVSIKFGNNSYNLIKLNECNVWHYKSSTLSLDRHNKAQLNEQMENYKQLQKMEPNNKWALLTGIFLMKNNDFVAYHKNILADLSLLMNIDHLRKNYYADIRSKCTMDYKLYEMWQNENDQDNNSIVDLSNLDLTTFYNDHYFTLCEKINLTGNHLNRSLHRLATLQDCRNLSLANNNLKSVKHFPTLPNLEYLSLRCNDLADLDEILNLLSRHKLAVLDIRDNPISELDNTKLQVLNICPDIDLKVN